MHAVYVEMFHPSVMVTSEQFEKAFSSKICSQFPDDSAECKERRHQFQTALIREARLTVEICRLVTSSVVSESDLTRFQTLSRELVTLVETKVDPIIGRVTVADEDDDAERRPAEFGDDNEVNLHVIGEGNQRGTVPTTGSLCTPSVRNLMAEFVMKVREQGSFAYGSEVIGEFNQGDVETTAINTNSREDSMHKQMMDTTENRKAFTALLCGAPWIYTDDALFDITDDTKYQGDVVQREKQASKDRVNMFVGKAYLGQLEYPGQKLMNLGGTPAGCDKKLMKLLQDKVSHSLFNPPENKLIRLYGAMRLASASRMYLRLNIDGILHQLLAIAGILDENVTEEWRNRVGNRLVQTCCVKEAYMDMLGPQHNAERLGMYTRLISKNTSLQPGSFMMVKFDDGPRSVGAQDLNGGRTAEYKVGVAQLIGNVVFCNTSTTCDPDSASVVICWFEPELIADQRNRTDEIDRNDIYGYPKYFRHEWEIIKPNCIVRQAHVIPNQVMNAHTDAFDITHVLLNELAHYPTAETL